MDRGRDADKLRGNNVKGKIMYLVNRLREPSTMAGLSVLAVLFGAPTGTVDIVVQAVASVAAAAAVFMPDQKAE